ncbi:MAG: Ig-like domain-containing protein [Reichenbachiella sp.]|uniref:Ig-like domain-containing protein n=1 Tax=Reichenbachiella sp. TaxID=2184521 RepID=UPI00326655A5
MKWSLTGFFQWIQSARFCQLRVVQVKFFLFSVLTLCLNINRLANAQEYLSHDAFSSSFDFKDATIDASGNIYVIGSFSNTIDLNPGVGTVNVSTTNQWDYDICVIKLDANGNYLWGHAIGGDGEDRATSLAVDGAGKVYITGYFNNKTGDLGIDFNPTGGGTLTSFGGSDIFVWILDASGGFVYARNFGGTGNDTGEAIDLDASGNIFTHGLFYGTSDFQNNGGSVNVAANGDRDVFTMKMDSNGDYLWVKHWGQGYTNNGSIDDNPGSMKVDSQGNVITAMAAFRPIDMDPSAGTDTPPVWQGSYDIYTIKLDNDGNYVFGRQSGGNGTELFHEVITDTDDNIIIMSRFDNTIDLNFEAGDDTVTPEAGIDFFIVKMSSSGAYQWGATISESYQYQDFAMATDKHNNVYISGRFGDAPMKLLDQSKATVAEFTPKAASDGFLVKLDANGNFFYAEQMMGDGDVAIEKILVDDNLDMTLVGLFTNTTDMDVSHGTTNQLGSGIYVSNYAQDVYFTSASEVDVPENQLSVLTVAAKDMQDPSATLPITYSITGGTDQALFNIDGTFGILSFKDPHTYQAGSNDYQVEVTAQNTNESNTQLITATIVDVIPPSISIASIASNPTRQSTIPVTVTFSEAVTGFEEADLTINGGTVNSFTGSGDTYTFDLTSSSWGTMTVDVAAGAAVDVANNNNTVASQFSIVYMTPVTVTNTSTSGAGSLDQAIQDMINSSGAIDSIKFDPSLKGQTISVTEQYSLSAESLAIFGDVDNDGIADITLQSDGTNHRFFALTGTADITLSHLEVGSFSTTSDGGVFHMSEGTLTLENCVIKNNAARSGGVVYYTTVSGNINISKSIFSGNSATSQGGVIYQLSFFGVNTVIENSLFFDNSAPNSNGGVAYVEFGSNLILRHVTLTNNSAKFGGGAIYNSNNVTTENSLIVGNHSESGSNNVQNSRTFHNAGGSILGGEDGASDDVVDYFVDATNGDYNLILTSPAVNAGVNSLSTIAGITADIVGNVVPYDGIVDIVDAGAYEFQGDPPIGFESESVINSNTMTVTFTFNRAVTGLDNADFSTKAGALSLASLTTSDNVEYTATFTLSDLTEKVIDTVYMDAMVEDVLNNMAQVKDTLAYVFYVPVAHVTNTQTSGEGSLDQALQDFIDSKGTVNTVEFDPSLSGSTIMITKNYSFIQGTLLIDGDIDDDGIIDITLQSDGQNHGLFNVNGSTSLTLNKIRVIDFSPSSQWGPVALVNSNAASLTMTGCEIRNNSTGGHGGPIYCENGNVSIKQSIFSNNSAVWGGAVTIYSGGTTIIENSLFEGNSANTGGAIYGRNGANITVRHCTFSDNSSTGNGGAIYNLKTLKVENSLFVANTAGGTGDNIQNDSSFDNVGGNILGGEEGASNDIADYFTDATNDDYTLYRRSLAADLGVNSLATDAGITTDLLGNARPFAGNAQVVDVGAYELQADPDFVAPTVSISSTAADPTNLDPFPITIEFSEEVGGFESGDIVVANGAVSTFNTVDNITFTVTISPVSEGAVTVNVAANVAADVADNSNTAAEQFSIDSDRTAPKVNITTTAGATTNVSPIPVTVNFDEPTTGLEEGELIISGGTVSNFSITMGGYSFDLIPTGEGILTVDIDENSAMDLAGNGHVAAEQFSITYDLTAPSLSLSTTLSSPTNTNLIPVTATFSEAVTDFESSDLTVTGGTVANFAGSGADYSFDLIPSADGELTVNVNADVAMDVLGYGNSASAQLAINYDSTAPTVNIATTSTSPTNDNPIPVTVMFSETVTGFEAGDVVVVGGTVSNFSGSGDAYTFDLTPTEDGTLTVDVAASMAVDASGNGNLAAPRLSIENDATAPVVTIDLLDTNDQTPKLTGTVNDNEAVISITIDGQTLTATNNGDGTWTLMDDQLSEINFGTHNVIVTATDKAMNIGSDMTVDELTISPITGLKGIENHLVVYPNPTSDGFWVSAARQSGLDVYSPDGTLLIKSETNQFIDIQNLNNGIYLVIVENRTVRLIVNK